MSSDTAISETPEVKKKSTRASGTRRARVPAHSDASTYRQLRSAIDRSQAVIEFDLDGNIVDANENFLATMGYSIDEVRGQHHRLFVDPALHRSDEYRRFWTRLASGEYFAGEFKRIGRGGREVWLHASYNPLLDESGRPVRVVKLASDITESKRRSADHEGQLRAISKALAVIEFSLDGVVLDANENFCATTGYTLDEVRGRHHRMFCHEAFRSTDEYRALWAQLARGEYVAGQFKRVGRNGQDIWIQASYNPILDSEGRPWKVVKYATDITAQVRSREAILANAAVLASASVELAELSRGMNASATSTSERASDVSVASEQVSQNVQSVAAATEEMSASIREIARNAADAARVATGGVRVANDANAKVARLGESSAEIGKVLKVITSIAQQTNLLALNATIEAARAGEAGKGFAVVANEVKELAKGTARATESIAQMIETIQADTRGAVAALAEISGVVTDINGIQTMIASAVEEQTATTREIARNVAESATGSDQIATKITEVARTARETSSGAERAQHASTRLAQMAAELQRLGAS